MRALERQFDAVIVDGPPVMSFADGPLLAAAVEATILVVASRATSRSMAQNAIARLQATGGNIIGGVLNKFDASSARLKYGHSSYGYGYKYGGPSRQRSLIAPAIADSPEQSA